MRSRRRARVVILFPFPASFSSTTRVHLIPRTAGLRGTTEWTGDMRLQKALDSDRRARRTWGAAAQPRSSAGPTARLIRPARATPVEHLQADVFSHSH